MEIIVGSMILFAVVWAISVKMFPHTVTLKEGAILLGIQTFVMVVIYSIGMSTGGSDVAILNGAVTSKERDEVSCHHSYSCNCRTSCSGSGNNRSCSTVCQTCYEHGYDVDWIIHSTVGSIDIDTLDRQGLKQPPRWTSVRVGDFFAKQVSYYNYIKASPYSIFNKSKLNENVPIPLYPHIYDYYKINRVVNFTGMNVDVSQLNDSLNEGLSTLGMLKKVNVIVTLHNQDSAYNEKLRTKVLGGKINDVWVSIGLNKDLTFNNVSVFSWSKSDMVNVALRDSLLDIGKFEGDNLSKVILKDVKEHYVRRSIEEFKYLEEDAELPNWVLYLLMFIGIVSPLASSYVAHRNDL